MGLLIKGSLQAFWNTKEAYQLCSEAVYIRDRLPYWYLVDFSEIEGDSRKLKKVHKLIQYFCEQCRPYVFKQNITYKHWWKFEID